MTDEISIHVPREGHDSLIGSTLPAAGTFQSTCPARGTTGRREPRPCSTTYFNPRAPRGARQQQECDTGGAAMISIHVPREGHDSWLLTTKNARNRFQSTCPARGTTCPVRPDERMMLFQSTCPARGTTFKYLRRAHMTPISIHVPREGHDGIFIWLLMRITDFNPRAPRGARLSWCHPQTSTLLFQSTCPARGTTNAAAEVPREAKFQSTCPARGTTGGLSPRPCPPRDFNPRAPRGARRHSSGIPAREVNFNPRAPRGARRISAFSIYFPAKFQSTCPARGTTELLTGAQSKGSISIHVPREGHDPKRSEP